MICSARVNDPFQNWGKKTFKEQPTSAMAIMGVEDDVVNNLWYCWNLAHSSVEIIVDFSRLLGVEARCADDTLLPLFNNLLQSHFVWQGLWH